MYAGFEYRRLMETLEPKIVLVYGKVPEDIQEKYGDTRFVEYLNWTSSVRSK